MTAFTRTYSAAKYPPAINFFHREHFFTAGTFPLLSGKGVCSFFGVIIEFIELDALDSQIMFGLRYYLPYLLSFNDNQLMWERSEFELVYRLAETLHLMEYSVDDEIWKISPYFITLIRINEPFGVSDNIPIIFQALVDKSKLIRRLAKY